MSVKIVNVHTLDEVIAQLGNHPTNMFLKHFHGPQTGNDLRPALQSWSDRWQGAEAVKGGGGYAAWREEGVNRWESRQGTG